MVGEDNNSPGEIFNNALPFPLNANIDNLFFKFLKIRFNILRYPSHDEVRVHNGTLWQGIKVFISKDAYTPKGDQDEIFNQRGTRKSRN